MPYDSLADLPPALKTTLKNKGWSSAKKNKFLEILNALFEGDMEEGMAIATALKKAGKMNLSHYCVTDRPAGRFLLIGAPTSEGRRFRKEIARVGVYTHPKGKLDFTRNRLAKWLLAFQEMKAAGIKVPVPLNHGTEPMDNAGWVLDMSMAGGLLLADMVITRSDVADRLEDGSIQDISIGIGDMADDKSHYWDDAITEVALVTQPHIRVQEGFIALSRATDQGDNEVELKEALEKLDEANKRIAELEADAKNAEGVKGLEVKLSAAEAAKGAAETERDTLKVKVAKQETAQFEAEMKAEVLKLKAAHQVTPAEEGDLEKTLISLRATPEARANILKLYTDRKPAPTSAKTILGAAAPDEKADLKLKAVTEAARLDNLTPEDYTIKLKAAGHDPERIAWFTIHKDGTPFPDGGEPTDAVLVSSLRTLLKGGGK